MSVDLAGFDANQVDPSVGFDPIPKGEYLALVIDSEKKETAKSKNEGTDEHLLQFTWEIVEGDFKARRLWSRLNLWNRNDMAVKIAQSELSAICHATGVMVPKDSAEFHNKPVTLSVDLEPYKDGYSNVIKDYTAPGKTKAAPAKEAKKSAPPWAK